MKKVHLAVCTLLIFLSALCLISITYAEPRAVPTNIKLKISISDVDQTAKSATIRILVSVFNYSSNKTKVTIWISGGGMIEVNCSNIEPERDDQWIYEGESNPTTWFLEGAGEAFPFDSYSLRFSVSEAYSWSNISLNSDSYAEFVGPKVLSLKDVWGGDETLPKSFTGDIEVSFSIVREWQTPFLQILVPIIACYYLLASSLILRPLSDLGKRLRIYVSLFVFSPTFFFAIRSFLPYRSTLSIPELLLTNLIISNAGFGVASIVANGMIPRIKNNYRRMLLERVPDFMAALLCSQFLFIFLLSSVIAKMTLFHLLIIIGSQIPIFIAYYGLLAVYLNRRARVKRKNQ